MSQRRPRIQGEPRSARSIRREQTAARKAAAAAATPPPPPAPPPELSGRVSPTLERMLRALRRDPDPSPPHEGISPASALVLTHEPLITHKVARCRWCGGLFRFIDQRFWICTSEACAERQLEHAVRQREGSATAPVLFLPLPIQVDIKLNPTVHLLVAGAAGISKSYGSRWMTYGRCRKVGGYRALLLRNTYDELEKNHLQFMQREAELLGAATFKMVRSTRVFTFHENDSRIYMGYCDSDADIDRHLGPEWDEVIFEEGVLFPPRALNEISARARGAESSRIARWQLKIEGGRTRVLTNPGGRAMLYLVEHYIERNPDREDFPTYDASQYGFITGTLVDNPYLAENYAETSLGGLSAARYKQLRHGDWSVVVSQFFEGFDAGLHIQPMEAS